LHLAPGTIGLLFGLGAAGSMVGAVAAGWTKRRLGLGPAIVTELVVCCCAPLLAAAAPGRTALGVALYVATFVLCGMGATMSTVHIVSLRQSITEDGMLGRVNAGCRFLAWGPLPLGALFGGFLSESIGLHGALVVTCVSFVLALLWVVFSPVPRLRDIADVGPPAATLAVPALAGAVDPAVESGAAP
jgi:MFS family permease